MVLGQLLPLFRLRGEHEVHDVARKQTQLPVVVVRLASAVAARQGVREWLRGLADCGRISGYGVRSIGQQRPFDRVLEAPLGDGGVHP